MQNSNALEKSRGIVALAVNTASTDYESIAHQTVALASRVLGLPYTIITEDMIKDKIYHNTRFDVDTGQFVEWKNMGRSLVYALSPYDETLVIDVDYVVQDQSLLSVFETEWDYILTRDCVNLDDQLIPETMGPHSLPYVWATVFAFRKTPKSQMFFELVDRVQNNYHYYRDLYKIDTRNYRNDYAFAIADHILNGFVLQRSGMPFRLLNVLQPIHTIEVRNNQLIIKDQARAYVIPRMNLHVMSKSYLQSDNFKKFVQDATT
jgi:hypothetical protein